MRGQLFSTDFLASVLVLSVTLGLFVHSVEFVQQSFPGSPSEAARLSAALLSARQTLDFNPAAISQSGCNGQASGSAFCFTLPQSGPVSRRFADTGQDPSGSLSVLYENGVPLGPAHSSPADIINLGAGRYTDVFDASTGSHYVLFSSSDGSTPGQNGLAYRFEFIPAPVVVLPPFCVHQSVLSSRKVAQDNCEPGCTQASDRFVRCGSFTCAFSVRTCGGRAG